MNGLDAGGAIFGSHDTSCALCGGAAACSVRRGKRMLRRTNSIVGPLRRAALYLSLPCFCSRRAKKNGVQRGNGASGVLVVSAIGGVRATFMIIETVPK